MKKHRLVMLFCLAVLFPMIATITRAQEPNCSDFVKKALELTSQQCTGLERNKACYGNVLVEAAPRDGVDPAGFKFAQPGDVAALENIQTLRLGGLDQATNQWGVAYMRLRANLPDIAAGQFVTAILFGDSEIRDASTELAKSSGQAFTPMQAFYFRTGLGGADAACSTFPSDGLLLQTPKGAGQVALVVNEVKLTFGSTIMLQAPGSPETFGNLQTLNTPSATPGESPSMLITVFEGEAQVEANGQQQVVAPGQQVSVPLDQNSRPAGPPNAPTYNDSPAQAALTSMVAELGDDALIDPRTPEPTATLVPTATATTQRVVLPVITWTPSATPPPPSVTPLPVTLAPPVPTNTQAPTLTPTVTNTPSDTPTPSNTPTPSLTYTPSMTPTDTPTNTPTLDITITLTPTPTDTDTPSCAVGVPASISIYAGSPQSAVVTMPFSLPLQVLVEDACSLPVSNVTVTFTAPGSGASGLFGNLAPTDASNTDASGIAISSTFAANTIAGTYSVVAEFDVSHNVVFSLTNLPDVATGLNIFQGDAQNTLINTAFPFPLAVWVRDGYGNPIAGAPVTFTAPASLASGTFTSTSTEIETVISDGSGMATSSTFTANAFGGSYTVTASSGVASATFNLTNNAP